MNGDSTGQDSGDIGYDIRRQQRMARDLRSDAEDLSRLIGRDTAALGSEEIAHLHRLRERLGTRADELADEAARRGAAPQGKTPGRGGLGLARTVVVCYLMFLFAFMGYLFAKSHLMHVDVTSDIIEMLKVFLLPIVTLVLGFYFGASRR